MTEQRRNLRINLEESIEMVIEMVEGKERLYSNVSLLIEDVSSFGIRFTTVEDFAVDEVLNFKVPSIDISTLFKGRIVWKKKDEGTFRYGFEIFNENTTNN